MSTSVTRINTQIDTNLFKILEGDMIEFKTCSSMRKHRFLEETDWDLKDWKSFIESAILKWKKEEDRMNIPWWKKEVVIR